MNPPKISIITSVFRADEFIDGFMKDITRQTIFADCELLLINANSPGNEEAIIRGYLGKHPNIIYKKLDSDPGLYGVWNMGVRQARAPYLTNANVDDRKAPWSLERHALELDAHPDVELVYAETYCTRTPNETFEFNHALGIFPPTAKECTLRTLLDCDPPQNNPMWRKTLHDRHGLFDEGYRSAGDWEMWLRAFVGGATFRHIKQVLGLYYENPRGLSTDQSRIKMIHAEHARVRDKYRPFLARQQPIVAAW